MIRVTITTRPGEKGIKFKNIREKGSDETELALHDTLLRMIRGIGKALTFDIDDEEHRDKYVKENIMLWMGDTLSIITSTIQVYTHIMKEQGVPDDEIEKIIDVLFKSFAKSMDERYLEIGK